MDLSDFWIVEVVRAGLKSKDRSLKWPAVFTQKWLSSKYINKGKAAKYEGEKGWYCSVIFDKFEMHGQEGIDQGLFAPQISSRQYETLLPMALPTPDRAMQVITPQ